MDRWSGILKVPLSPQGTVQCRVAASLCVSPDSRALVAPSANAIFFNGDRVQGTGNPVIERCSDIQNIANILALKFNSASSCSCINTWVIEASTFNGPFAVYKEFIPSINQYGEPQTYKADGFPASTSLVSLLSNFLEEWAKHTVEKECQQSVLPSKGSFPLPQTYVLGFSKGGTVLNQLLTELGFSNRPMEDRDQPFGRCNTRKETSRSDVIPISSRESLLDSITQIHYVDVGLNSHGAYLTDDLVINRVAERLVQQQHRGISFVLHGTPRQWCDSSRAWICNEKDTMAKLLESEARRCGRKLLVTERFYFADRSHPELQMHFEIIEKLDVSRV